MYSSLSHCHIANPHHLIINQMQQRRCCKTICNKIASGSEETMIVKWLFAEDRFGVNLLVESSTPNHKFLSPLKNHKLRCKSWLEEKQSGHLHGNWDFRALSHLNYHSNRVRRLTMQHETVSFWAQGINSSLGVTFDRH